MSCSRGTSRRVRTSKGEEARKAVHGNNTLPVRGSGVTSAEVTGRLRRNAGRRRTATLKAAQKKYNCWEEGIMRIIV